MSKKRPGLRRKAVGLTVIAAAAVFMVFYAAGALANTPLPHAAFTTVNETADGTGHCANGNPAVNCNIYDGKQYVWLNGGPVAAGLSDGTYFFAVLVPGGQGGNENPNDGTQNDLSDLNPSTNTGAGDVWTDRIFTVSNGAVSYTGPHDFANNKIRLMPYDDTTNPGGVYILAICSLADSTADAADPTTWGTNPPGVDPSDCKYDAFKVNDGASLPPADDLSVTKGADGTYDTTYTWGISKSADKTSVTTTNSTASFTYTVHVTHDAGTIGSIGVSGIITITNPNASDVVVNVSDVLSDSTACTVMDGTTVITSTTDVTAGGGPGTKSLDYSCSITGSTVPSDLTNMVTVSWGSQLLDDGSFLAAGSAPFTTDPIAFANSNVHDCTYVTDPIPTGGTSSDNPFPTTVCVGGSGDGGAGTDTTDGFTFTYHVTYPVTPGCHDFDNTATEATNGNFSSVTVTVCGPANNSALTMGFWKGPNGQSLITNYGSGLYVWLDQYAPLAGVNSLADINAVFKAATSTNMNNMLKAQMLATALDVYFSGPGYSSTPIGSGKNQIKPPSSFLTHGPLGGFNMDMTAVCPMVDNTTAGTATCKNNTPSTDSFASGAVNAAAMTVSQILTFASTLDTTPPYNLGAYGNNSIWYLNTTVTPNTQDRTKQEILKNIFDQINNNVAFGA
jgi:hypothetical protein